MRRGRAEPQPYGRCDTCKIFTYIKEPKTARRRGGGRARLNAIHVGQRIDDSSDAGTDEEDDSDLEDFIVADDEVEFEAASEPAAASHADAPEGPSAVDAASRATSAKPEGSDAHDSSFQGSTSDSD